MVATPYFCQRCRGQTHQFSKLIQELRASETAEYSAAILGFVNCLLASADNMEERVHIRNEMQGGSVVAIAIIPLRL